MWLGAARTGDVAGQQTTITRRYAQSEWAWGLFFLRRPTSYPPNLRVPAHTSYTFLLQVMLGSGHFSFAFIHYTFPFKKDRKIIVQEMRQ